MPRGKGEKISKRQEHLTDFGVLFYRLCEYLHVSAADIAERSGVSHAAISKGTRRFEEPGQAQTRTPSRETVEALYAAFERFASEKNLQLSSSIKMCFYNLDPVMYATPEQSEDASERVKVWSLMIEEAVETAKRQRQDELTDHSHNDTTK